MKSSHIQDGLVRYGELQPCKTAFIDSNTPGSDRKENFTIIGGGVSESADQHVHIKRTFGFNIGAAGQPPRCTNSLHSHDTAEVFFVLKGRWRFFWGRHGDAGQVFLQEGDIFNIPTEMFRGFENVGQDYGMIMAVLGGDDPGGVEWTPEVLERAKNHGLILAENGVLFDTNNGQVLPDELNPMPVLSEQALKSFREPKTQQVVSNFVARYLDLMSLSAGQAALNVIGPNGIINDRPGFDMDFISDLSLEQSWSSADFNEVYMACKGHWSMKLDCEDGLHEVVLAPGDTLLVPANIRRRCMPAMSGEAAMYRVRENQDKAGKTQW